jgi:hypothetical protein
METQSQGPQSILWGPEPTLTPFPPVYYQSGPDLCETSLEDPIPCHYQSVVSCTMPINLSIMTEQTPPCSYILSLQQTHNCLPPLRAPAFIDISSTGPGIHQLCYQIGSPSFKRRQHRLLASFPMEKVRNKNRQQSEAKMACRRADSPWYSYNNLVACTLRFFPFPLVDKLLLLLLIPGIGFTASDPIPSRYPRWCFLGFKALRGGPWRLSSLIYSTSRIWWIDSLRERFRRPSAVHGCEQTPRGS